MITLKLKNESNKNIVKLGTEKLSRLHNSGFARYELKVKIM